jgi:heterodisulfide reductase subunit D
MFKKIFRKIIESTGNTLYYPGCTTKFMLPEIETNYTEILRELKIDFIKIKEFNCCGGPVINAGYEKEFIELIKKNKLIFKKYGITRIISNCPLCVKIFKEHYDISAMHITQILFKNIDKLETKYDTEPISYHDSCNLGRGLGIYEEPRKILEKLGFEVIEFINHKENSSCCGAGGGVKFNFSKIADKAGVLRLSESRTKKLITACPMCYKHLKENSKSIEVFELSEVLR